LGDQLSPDLASLRGLDPAATVVLMMEVADEATYVRHHKKKIAFLFAAMRHFAAELRAGGWTVDYVTLDDPANGHSFTSEVARAVERHAPSRIRVVEPGEWRVQAMFDTWSLLFGCTIEVLPDDRFFASKADFAAWAEGRREFRMEWFYRDMRRRTGLLMRDGKPEGGQWNYDHDNRKRAPKGLRFPGALTHVPDEDTRAVFALVDARFDGHFGDVEPFGLPVTRAQALASLDHFVCHALPHFGDYQDAMVDGEDLLFHSWLSPAMNCGLLLPREVCDAAEAAYRAGHAPLNAVEGFIRQILGWREYVRGIYWHQGPEYPQRNMLRATRSLPDFYWTGETDMRCLADAVSNTRRNAYAHHIQRLMVLGNFAMLAGVDPQAVADWFLVVYADAYEWVEAPNVVGMSQHADGGLLGSKPYAAGGAYIDRMSDHCGKCRYDVKARTGPDACPFNALYWDFLARHRERFERNPRMANMYRTWDRFAPEVQRDIRDQTAAFLGRLQPAGPGWARA
jgi:deoxyribodipyrimidine photolyase-related protein